MLTKYIESKENIIFSFFFSDVEILNLPQYLHVNINQPKIRQPIVKNVKKKKRLWHMRK